MDDDTDVTTISGGRPGFLRCPVTHEPLRVESGALVSTPSGRRYELDSNGIPLFARECTSGDARVQEAHYDHLVSTYLTNLTYPHTVEYMAYFDRVLLDDFFLRRLARRAVYRLSSALDAGTERPLRREPTVLALDRAGFRLQAWRPLGFIGCCFLMNSDVLVFNRLFRFVPGIRPITRFMASLDDAALRVPGLHHAGAGVAVVGVAARA